MARVPRLFGQLHARCLRSPGAEWLGNLHDIARWRRSISDQSTSQLWRNDCPHIAEYRTRPEVARFVGTSQGVRNMSTQVTRLLSPIPQSELLQFHTRSFDCLKYLIQRMTSCWHRNLTRPFTHGKNSYRVCLHCGMQHEFDLQCWKSTGRFYSPSTDRRIGT